MAIHIPTTPIIICDPCGSKCRGTNVKTRYYLRTELKDVKTIVIEDGLEVEKEVPTEFHDVMATEACDEKWAAVGTATAKFDDAARVETLPGKATATARAAKGSKGGAVGGHDNTTIRSWAKASNIPVKDQGALTADVYGKYYRTFPERKPVNYNITT